MPKTTEDIHAAGYSTATTSTGPADLTHVPTRWEAEHTAYVTRVSEYVGARWIPLEYQRNTTQIQASKAHQSAVRRHPRNGTTRTRPRTYDEGYCSRCGAEPQAEHGTDCRE